MKKLTAKDLLIEFINSVNDDDVMSFLNIDNEIVKQENLADEIKEFKLNLKKTLIDILDHELFNKDLIEIFKYEIDGSITEQDKIAMTYSILSILDTNIKVNTLVFRSNHPLLKKYDFSKMTNVAIPAITLFSFQTLSSLDDSLGIYIDTVINKSIKSLIENDLLEKSNYADAYDIINASKSIMYNTDLRKIIDNEFENGGRYIDLLKEYFDFKINYYQEDIEFLAAYSLTFKDNTENNYKNVAVGDYVASLMYTFLFNVATSDKERSFKDIDEEYKDIADENFLENFINIAGYILEIVSNFTSSEVSNS